MTARNFRRDEIDFRVLWCDRKRFGVRRLRSFAFRSGITDGGFRFIRGRIGTRKS
jgi:hypothetical protein